MYSLTLIQQWLHGQAPLSDVNRTAASPVSLELRLSGTEFRGWRLGVELNYPRTVASERTFGVSVMCLLARWISFTSWGAVASPR